MSIYSILASSTPTIAYSVLHQSDSVTPKAEYSNAVGEFHRIVQEEMATISEQYSRFIAEATAREAQAISNSLAEFLQTPIRSDVDEVRNLIQEGLGRLRRQLLDEQQIGLLYSNGGRYYFPSLKKSTERRLLQNGKDHLERMGYQVGKGLGDIFESVFAVNGGMSGDILQHIVQGRMGTHTIHEGHSRTISRYPYIQYDLLQSSGRIPDVEAMNRYIEVDFVFSAPSAPHMEFVSTLTSALEQLVKDIEIEHHSLWLRRSSLGVGTGFVLRLISSGAGKLSESIRWIDSCKDKPDVRDTLVLRGSLLVKELLF
jgi:hypothetical protein